MRFLKKILICMFMLGFFFSPAQKGTIEDSIFLGNMYRRYILYVPPIYTSVQAVPLVFNLHGLGSNPGQQMQYGSFIKIADTANFIVVHPQGTGTLPFWNAGFQSEPNDVEFISALIDSLKRTYNIDPDRVYSCGFSNGGIMSLYLACTFYSGIAAVASVSGTMFDIWFNSCRPQRPLPVMLVNGTADEIVPYDGSGFFVAVDSVIKKWTGHNSCDEPVIIQVPDINSTDGSNAVNFVYSGGYDGSSVELFRIENGGHSWPNGPPIFPYTNYDMDASVEIWRFFRQFRLSQFETKVGIAANSKVKPQRVYPNPCDQWLYIDGKDQCYYRIRSIEGKLVSEGISGSGGRVNVGLLSDGMYLLFTDRDLPVKFVKNSE